VGNIAGGGGSARRLEAPPVTVYLVRLSHLTVSPVITCVFINTGDLAYQTIQSNDALVKWPTAQPTPNSGR
jgi:hypothetical protein